ncbi:MAG: HAD family phosphatase [Cyanobacteria bacterium J007]|jgi:HAD superfamily hydrolase (TIGR01509 family)|nr:MAG: HAD family phosphatase [Cyanobacteria bacterium J007]
MSIKAVLFDFNGVIVDDEPLHEQLIGELLIEENLRPKPGEFREICLGRSDRACLREVLMSRGRFVTDDYLDELVARKAKAYHKALEKMEQLPIFPGVEELIYQLHGAQLKLAIVTGALRAEVELVLHRTNLAEYFSAIVAGDDVTTSKPQPDGYRRAIARLNDCYPDLHLKPSQCLAIEDTPPGIEAAKRAGIAVVGVANTYPFHMLQRQANWTVDYLRDLELDRIQQVYAPVA